MIDDNTILEYRKFYDENGYLPHKAAERLIFVSECLWRVVRAAEGTDHRCLKYGVLGKGRVCLDVESWKGENDLSCLNCKLMKALAALRSEEKEHVK